MRKVQFTYHQGSITVYWIKCVSQLSALQAATEGEVSDVLKDDFACISNEAWIYVLQVPAK